MTRVHFYRPVQDSRGDLKGNLSVRLLEPGTTTLISDPIYTASTGTGVRGNSWSADNSVVDFYLDRPRRVRIGVAAGSDPEIYFEDIEVGSVVEGGAGFYNVTDYGAKGDGLTSDTAAIQAAIDAASNVGGGTVTLIQGKTYACATALVAKDNVTLHIPAGSRILRTAPHSGGFITNASFSTKVNNFAVTGAGRIVGASFGVTAAQVIALYGDNLRLSDFTIDTYAGGQAILIGGDRIRMDRVTVLNTQAVAGTGGVRMFGGTDFRAAGLHVESGDDALQFTPIATVGSPIRDLSISNAYYIGCTGIASQGRSMIVTQTGSPSGSGGLTCSIKDVGFIGCQGTGTTRAIVVSNVDSTGDLSGVSFTDCTVDQSADTYVGQEVYMQASATGGRIRDIRFTRLHVISPNTTALSTQGVPASGKYVENVTLTDCVLEASRTTVSTLKPFAVDGLTIRGGRIDGMGGTHVIEGGTGVNAAKNIRILGTRITGIGNGFGGIRHAETAGFTVQDCKFVCTAGATTAVGVSVAATSSKGIVRPRGNDYTDLNGAGISGGGAGVLLDTTFDVRDFNAKGDGVTADDVAINAALTFCSVNGGGDVLVPYSASNYMFGSVITLRSNVRLLLGGNLKALATCTSMALQATNRNNVTIEGLPGGGIIDMNKAQTTNGGSTATQMGIYLLSNVASPTTNLTVRRVTVKNGWQQGIRMSGSVPAGGLVSNGVIEDCTVTDVGNTAIYVSGSGLPDKVTASLSQDILIRRNNISFPTVAGFSAIQVVGCSFFRIRDNILDGGGLATNHGITISSSGASSHCTDFIIDGNFIKGFTIASWGICLSMNNTRFAVTNNECVGNFGGISCDLEDSTASNVAVNAAGVVEGNRCLNSAGNHGFNTNCASNLTYANNRSSGATAGGGIAISQSINVTVVGNSCHNNSARGIAVFGNVAGTGLHEISGNLCRSNAGGDYYIDPTTPQPCRGDFAMAGAPALNAGPGSTYRRTDGGAGTTLYVKETASSSAVWAAK